MRTRLTLLCVLLWACLSGRADAQLSGRTVTATTCLAVGSASCTASPSPVKLAGLPAKTSQTACLWFDGSGNAYSGACGTVTSVALSVPSFLSVSGSPITTAGTLAVSLANQTAFTVFARASGTGVPSFLSLAKGHLPAEVAYEDEANIFTSSQSGTGYNSQLTSWRITQPGEADFRYLFTDEMHAKQFVADLTSITNGIDQTKKSSAMLAATFTCPAAGATATLTVRDRPSMLDTAVFQANDWVTARNFSMASGAMSIAECVGQVTSYADQANDVQTWTFTRGTSTCAGGMSTSATIATDSLVVDDGVSGQGYTEANAVDGTYGANSPYYQLVTWSTCPIPANRNLRGRFGNLSGSYSYSGGSNIFGLAVGDSAATNLTIDPTNGFRIRHGTTNKLVADTSGNLTLSGNLSVTGSGIFAAGSGSEVSLTTAGVQIALSTLLAGADANAYKWTAGTAAGRIGAFGGADAGTSERVLLMDNKTATAGWTPTTSIQATKSDTSDTVTFSVVAFGASPNATLNVIDNGSFVNRWQWLSDRTVTEQNLEPITDGVDDLGSPGKRYGNIYLTLPGDGGSPPYVVVGHTGTPAKLDYFVGLSSTISVRKGDDSGACNIVVVVGLIVSTTC